MKNYFKFKYLLTILLIFSAYKVLHYTNIFSAMLSTSPTSLQSICRTQLGKMHCESNIIWVEAPDRNILARLHVLNQIMHEHKKLLSQIQPAKITHSTFYMENDERDFLLRLTNVSSIQIFALAWSGPRSSAWNSFTDTANVILKSYHPSLSDPYMCESLYAGKRSGFTSEIQYNGTMRCDLPANFTHSSLETYRLHHFDPPRTTAKLPEHYQPPRAITYAIVFENAIASNMGNVWNSDVSFTAKGCPEGKEEFPQNWAGLPYYDFVFSISHYWGHAHYHRSVEVTPRLAPFVHFLKSNPDIYILVPNVKDLVLQRSFEALGLEPRRMISGWVRGGRVYMPKPTACVTASVLETQLLAKLYRDHYNRLHPHRPIGSLKRNNLVYIKRSHRTFSNQSSVENAMRKLSADFKLDFRIFDDRKLPDLTGTIEMFYGARVVVAPHGAGLSNLLYAQPDTLVIEGIFEMRYANLCFEKVAYVLGMQYFGTLSTGGAKSVLNITANRIEKIVKYFLAKRFV